MKEKYFIAKCGGEDCPKRGDIDEAYYCNIDGDYCDEQRCQNCPHGITIPEAAGIMLRFGLLGRNFDYEHLPAQRQQREEELEHLLEVQNGKKQN